MTNQRRVLVVGGGSGIGQHITDNLIHKHNAKVLVFSLDVAPVVQEWEDQGKLHIVKGDATKPEVSQQAYQATQEYLGGLDSLVVTVGVMGQIERTEKVDIDSMRRTFEINVFAPVQQAQLYLPLLRQSKGSLLILSSAVDRDISWSAWGPYSSSKAALTRFIEILGIEEPEVKVLGIYPGLTRTPMVTDLIAGKFVGKMKDEDVKEFIRRDQEGEVEPPKWTANVTAKLAAATIEIPAQGRVLWYNEIDPKYKDA
ncbi:short-chain dehydrogenase [Seiridium cupressi]